ncbi:YggT family protein [Limnobacter sp.]|uniref:YggT family protein n=1 Tax=Limnobacter sp. TaxID=2003368 RepID=UPI0035194BCB
MLLIDILRLLLETAASLLTFCLLLRVLMQWVRIHPSNPLSPFIFSMTDWLVKPLRKAVPGYAGIDWASVTGAFLVSFVLHMLLVLISVGLSSGGPGLGGMITFTVPIAIFWVLRNVAYLLMGIVLIQVILSWVNPFSPIASVLNELSRPFLEPLRRVLPTIGNVDLSPLVFFLLLQIVMMVLQSLMPGF